MVYSEVANLFLLFDLVLEDEDDAAVTLPSRSRDGVR